METLKTIITLGLSPSWDVRCTAAGMEWGEHLTLDTQTLAPAGKAMNVSTTLAWLGRHSLAAGLWGASDYEEMLDRLGGLRKWIDVHMTRAPGQTRHNITLIDTRNTREMHLRVRSDLATPATLTRLREDIRSLAQPACAVAVSGSMPAGEALDAFLPIIDCLHEAGARIGVDTYGPALGRILERGQVWMLKPNLQELSEFVGQPVPNHADAIATESARLLSQAKIVVVSRGRDGAVLTCEQGSWSACTPEEQGTVGSTVGCGDALFAGLLDGFAAGLEPPEALRRGVAASAARAWGWMLQRPWTDVDKTVKVEIAPIDGEI